MARSIPVRGAYIDEVQLIDCATNADCEEEDVSLEPCDLCRRVLEADTWSRHVDNTA